MFNFPLIFLISSFIQFSLFSKCSSNELNDDKRFISGYTTFKSEYPYQVAIVHQDQGLICGGSIIASSWVLTAARCFDKCSIKDSFSIIAGNGRRHVEQEIRVSGVFVHERYNKYTLDNDIALLNLSVPFKYGTTVRNVKVSSSKVKKSRKCRLLGWNDQKSALVKVKMRTISNRKCRKYLKVLANQKNVYLSKRQFCAVPKCTWKKHSFCDVDTGSPLVRKKSQIGIMSFPADSLCQKTPSVFTKVSSHLQWITNVISVFRLKVIYAKDKNDTFEIESQMNNLDRFE